MCLVFFLSAKMRSSQQQGCVMVQENLKCIEQVHKMADVHVCRVFTPLAAHFYHCWSFPNTSERTDRNRVVSPHRLYATLAAKAAEWLAIYNKLNRLPQSDIAIIWLYVQKGSVWAQEMWGYAFFSWPSHCKIASIAVRMCYYRFQYLDLPFQMKPVICNYMLFLGSVNADSFASCCWS